MRQRNNIRVILVILLPILFIACGASNPMPPPAGADLPPGSDDAISIYQIGVGDVISVNVWGNPDLSLQVPVRPDGFISMPLIGDVSASETDAESLAARISDLLSDQVRSPQVTVIVSQVNSTEYISRVRVTNL